MLSRHACPMSITLSTVVPLPRELSDYNVYRYLEHFRSVVLKLVEGSNPTSVMQACTEVDRTLSYNRAENFG